MQRSPLSAVSQFEFLSVSETSYSYPCVFLGLFFLVTGLYYAVLTETSVVVCAALLLSLRTVAPIVFIWYRYIVARDEDTRWHPVLSL